MEEDLQKPTERRYVPARLVGAIVDVCGLINTDTPLIKNNGEMSRAQEKRNQTKEKLQALKDEYEKLQKDARVSREPWILARQLNGTPNGVPVELWFFSRNTDFVPFEDFASQYMEFFIASMADFGLRVFQLPAGTDLSWAALAGK